MIHIDLPADLNFVDDDGVNMARVPEPGAPRVGSVLVAGTPSAWSGARVESVDDGCARVESVDDGWVRFRLMTAREVAQRGSLIAQ